MPKPYIDAELLIGRERIVTPFMIDTGADITIVQPRIAAQVLSSQTDQSPTQVDVVQIFGVGRGGVRTWARTLGISLEDDEGQEHWFSSTVLLVDPNLQGSESAEWNLPSLLGRDVLSRFDFVLSYDPPTVSLTLTD